MHNESWGNKFRRWHGGTKGSIHRRGDVAIPDDLWQLPPEERKRQLRALGVLREDEPPLPPAPPAPATNRATGCIFLFGGGIVIMVGVAIYLLVQLGLR